MRVVAVGGRVALVEDLDPQHVVGVDVTGAHPLPGRRHPGEPPVPRRRDVEDDLERRVGTLAGSGPAEHVEHGAHRAPEHLPVRLGGVEPEGEGVQLHQRPDHPACVGSGSVVHRHPDRDARPAVETVDQDHRGHGRHGQQPEFGGEAAVLPLEGLLDAVAEIPEGDLHSLDGGGPRAPFAEEAERSIRPGGGVLDPGGGPLRDRGRVVVAPGHVGEEAGGDDLREVGVGGVAVVAVGGRSGLGEPGGTPGVDRHVMDVDPPCPVVVGVADQHRVVHAGGGVDGGGDPGGGPVVEFAEGQIDHLGGSRRPGEDVRGVRPLGHHHAQQLGMGDHRVECGDEPIGVHRAVETDPVAHVGERGVGVEALTRPDLLLGATQTMAGDPSARHGHFLRWGRRHGLQMVGAGSASSTGNKHARARSAIARPAPVPSRGITRPSDGRR